MQMFVYCWKYVHEFLTLFCNMTLCKITAYFVKEEWLLIKPHDIVSIYKQSLCTIHVWCMSKPCIGWYQTCLAVYIPSSDGSTPSSSPPEIYWTILIIMHKLDYWYLLTSIYNNNIRWKVKMTYQKNNKKGHYFFVQRNRWSRILSFQYTHQNETLFSWHFQLWHPNPHLELYHHSTWNRKCSQISVGDQKLFINWC